MTGQTKSRKSSHRKQRSQTCNQRLLTAAIQKGVAPKGTLISTDRPKNPFAGSIGWPSQKYSYCATVKFQNEDDAIKGLNQCHEKVSQLHIFDPNIDNPTFITFENNKTIIEEDLCVAITTYIGIRYVTSQERVSVYDYQKNESFVMCLSGCRENLIDGYYRIRGVRTKNKVRITYTKVQSLNGTLMRKIIGRPQYNTVNDKSARRTPEILAGYCTRGITGTSWSVKKV